MADDKKAKLDRRRKKAVEELLSTEKTYVHLMSKLVEHFVQKLRSNTSILSAEDYKILFPSDIHAILGLNQTFLKDLTNVIESDDFNNQNTPIGETIYAFCPHFKMYQNYLNNYSAAATRLAALRSKSSSSFTSYCDKQREEAYFNNLPLESLIILPIQRMPRYKMLLEEIIKHTELNHPDLKQLKNALSKISQVNDVINNRMKEFDSRIKVQNIENRFNGKITNLVTPSRRYIKQGQLCKIETKDDQDFLFILFSDCILYASQSMIGDKLIFGNLLHFNSKFKVQITSKSINVHSIENLFQIQSTNESFMLYASSNKEMHAWVDIILKTFKSYMALSSTVKNQDLNMKNIFAATLQIPNDFADKCMMDNCNTKFSFVNRRHHCKYCGFVCCSKCSSNQLQSRPTAAHHVTAMVKVCLNCYKINAGKTNINKSGNKSVKAITTSIPDTPTLTNKPSSKALELMGYSTGEIRRRSTLKSFNKVREDDLLKMFAKREQQFEEEQKKSAATAAAAATAVTLQPSNNNSPYSHSRSPSRSVPPPPPKSDKHSKQNSAVMDFVKLDIEPKLSALETDNKVLSDKVDTLQKNNESLSGKVATLEREITDSTYTMKQTADKLSKQNNELMTDNERLQTLVNNLSSMTDENKKAEEIQSTKIKTLEAHNANLQSELKQKEDEIKQLLNKQSVFMQYKQNNEKLEQQVREKDVQIEQLLHNQKQYQLNELLEYKQDNIELENRLRGNEATIQSLLGKFDQLQEIHKEMDEMTKTDVHSEINHVQHIHTQIHTQIHAQTENNEDKSDSECETVSVSVSMKPPSPQQITTPLSIVSVNVKEEKNNHENENENENQVFSPMTQYNNAIQSLYGNEQLNSFALQKENEEKEKEKEAVRVCQTCNKEIIGRALRTKGGLHHRQCHICNECKVSLAGKRYGITQSNGKKVKLCEICTKKANENYVKRMQKNNNPINKRRRGRSKSSLIDQMNQFRNNGNKMAKPWEINQKAKLKENKSNDNTLKPSIAASIAANKNNEKYDSSGNKSPKSKSPKSKSAKVQNNDNNNNNNNNNKLVPDKPSRVKKAKSVTKANGLSFVGYGGFGPQKKNHKSKSLIAQQKCNKCKSAIFGKNKMVGPNDKVFHPNCFRCADCDNELQEKNWRSYPIQSHRKKGNNKSNNQRFLTLCPKCVTKRDEGLFTKHKGKLKLNI